MALFSPVKSEAIMLESKKMLQSCFNFSSPWKLTILASLLCKHITVNKLHILLQQMLPVMDGWPFLLDCFFNFSRIKWNPNSFLVTSNNRNKETNKNNRSCMKILFFSQSTLFLDRRLASLIVVVLSKKFIWFCICILLSAAIIIYKKKKRKFFEVGEIWVFLGGGSFYGGCPVLEALVPFWNWYCPYFKSLQVGMSACTYEKFPMMLM